MRTVIIGDIHGCYVELRKLLEKAAFSVSDDTLICLGDYVDHGPDSCRVIAFLKTLGESMGGRLVTLRGNHEQLMLDHFYNTDNYELWLSKGGGETIASFKRHGLDLSSATGWLHSTEFYYETRRFIAAHAGVSPKGPAHTDKYTLLFDRELVKNGSYRGRLLIHGHTHMEHAIYQDGKGRTIMLSDGGPPQKLPKRGSICLDTSCVYGIRLTAMIIEDGLFRLESVKAEGKYK